MITIDRQSDIPIFRQLVQQLRFLIATGRMDATHPLPSTRSLAKTLGISFHTVRKAYSALEQEGVLEATVGSGYRVRDPSPLLKSDRMEQGAALMSDALRELIGLGLESSEIEYLFEEQLSLVESGLESEKIVFASLSLEVAEACAKQLAHAIQRPVEAVTLDGLERHRDADVVVAEFRDIVAVRERLPQSTAVGVTTRLNPEGLDDLSRLLPTETVGLVCRDPQSVVYLSTRIKFDAGFAGQIVATTVGAVPEDVSEFARRIDLLAYTPSASRRLHRSTIDTRTTRVTVEVDRESVASVTASLPAD